MTNVLQPRIPLPCGLLSEIQNDKGEEMLLSIELGWSLFFLSCFNHVFDCFLIDGSQ